MTLIARKYFDFSRIVGKHSPVNMPYDRHRKVETCGIVLEKRGQPTNGMDANVTYMIIIKAIAFSDLMPLRALVPLTLV